MRVLTFLFSLLSFFYYSSYKQERIFKTSSGDTITLESASLYNKRLNLNGNLAIDLEILYELNNPSLDISFYEMSNKYVFYGSIKNSECERSYLYLIDKDFSNYKVYLSKEVDISKGIKYVVEYPFNHILIVEEEKEDTDTMYSLSIYDLNLNLLDKTYIDHLEEPEVVYSYIKYGDKYFDELLNIYGSIERSKVVDGCFTLYTETYVNGTLYSKGSHFSEPGNYTLYDGNNESTEVLIDAIIDGVENNESYNSYITYKVSGGDVYIDGSKSYLSGMVDKVGRHNICVKGVGEYTKEISFTINPVIYNDLNSNIYEGDKIYFSGYAKVDDGEYIENYYECTKGTHKISLYLSKTGDLSETYYFTVLSSESPKKYIALYIVEGAIIVSLMSFIVVSFIIDKRRRKLNEV